MKDKRINSHVEQSSNRSQKRHKNSVINYIVLIVLALILLGLVGGIIAASVIFANKPENDGVTNVFISIASLLITLLTLIVPLTSYTLNKKEVEKISEDTNQKLENNDNKMTEAIERLGEIKVDFDNRYADLAESIVNGFSVDENESDNLITKVNIGYINALLSYDRGNYNDCKNKISRVYLKLIDLFKQLECEIGVDVKIDQKLALLTYKVYNLYRHVAGRTRDFANVIEALEDTINVLGSLADGKSSKIYVVVNYIMARTEIDVIEKSGDISNVENDDEIVSFINNINGYCNEINSVTKCDEKQREFIIKSIMARVYQIATRYSSNDETSEGIHRKDIYSGLSNLYLGDVCHILLHKGWRLNFVKYEIDKVLFNGCRFSVAKTLEKLSYNTKAIDKKGLIENAKSLLNIEIKYNDDISRLLRKEELLNNAKKILNELISEKRDPKYYLEISEIHKACGEWDESEKAAQYGYLLSPSDPLLAAQCAHISLRKYLLSSKNDGYYLHKANDCITNAFFTYLKEKELQENDSKHINIKFLYIPSLLAVISVLLYVQKVTGTESEDEITGKFNEINQYVNESFPGGNVSIVANSVPNYMRALISYYELYCNIVNANIRKKCIKEMFYICKRYLNNHTLWFSPDTEFFTDTGRIAQICLSWYKIYKPNAKIEVIGIDGKITQGIDGKIPQIINENGTVFTFHNFIKNFISELDIEANEKAFFERMFEEAYSDSRESFVNEIGKLIDGLDNDGEPFLKNSKGMYLKVI